MSKYHQFLLNIYIIGAVSVIGGIVFSLPAFAGTILPTLNIWFQSTLIVLVVVLLCLFRRRSAREAAIAKKRTIAAMREEGEA